MFRSLLLLFLCIFLSVTSARSQDTLVKRSGEIVLVKVLEVNTTDIRFKRFNNPDGPLYTIYKTEVKYIIFSNGLKENYETTPPPVVAPVPVVVQQPETKPDKSILTDGHLYLYMNRRIGVQEAMDIISKQKTPKLMLYNKRLNDCRNMQYLTAGAGLLLGLSAHLIVISASTGTLGNSGPQTLRNSEQTALTLAELGLACEAASLCFKIERRKRTRQLLDAYNASLQP